jgi:hypothetical protein
MDWPPLGNLLTTLDARLRHQLRDWRVLDNPPQTAQKPQAKNESRTTGWSKEVEARNRWIYKRVMAVTPYKTIIAELRRLIDAGRDWELISSPPGIRKAALEYANRKEVDPPSKRRN